MVCPRKLILFSRVHGFVERLILHCTYQLSSIYVVRLKTSRSNVWGGIRFPIAVNKRKSCSVCEGGGWGVWVLACCTFGLAFNGKITIKNSALSKSRPTYIVLFSAHHILSPGAYSTK